MYKNRGRGLKRPSSVLTSNASSNLQKSQKLSNDVQDIGSKNSTQSREEDSHARKKPALEKSKEKSKPDVPEKNREKDYVTQNKSQKSRNTKNIFTNYVDIDLDTMSMVFPGKFEELITKSGFKLQGSSEPFLLKKDQALFVRNLSILLAEKEENLELFSEGLEKFAENENNLKKMLSETKTDPDYKDARSSVQDSLIRMMLCVDSLQPKVLDLLLEKMAYLIQRDEDEIGDDTTPWVGLIVKSMCFLDQLTDGPTLFKNIFRLLPIAPLPVQQELIYNLPYIMRDSHHEEVADRLMKLMESKSELTPAVLEALGHLPLSAERGAEVRTSMLQSIKRAPIEYLPIIVKFVSIDEQSTHHDEIIQLLRKSLPFSRAGNNFILQKNCSKGSDSTQHSQSQSSYRNRNVSPADLASSKALTFRNLRGAFLAIPSLALAWIRSIKSVTCAKDHKPIDVIILLMMHSKESNRRKQVEALWRNRIKMGLFTNALLEETFEVLLEVLKRHTDDVLSVASVLLRSTESVVQDFGSSMYCLAFLHFESYMRKQVISELVLHIGTSETNAQSALDILLHLAQMDIQKLSDLSVHLQNLLDHIDDLSLRNVRKLMDLLCSVAYCPTAQVADNAGTLEDSISILLHKQIGSYDPVVKRKGVVSAIMKMKHMAGVSSDSSTSINNSSGDKSYDSLPPGRAKDASQLLDLVMRSTRSMPDALGYCLDQLSFMMLRCESLDPQFLAHLVEQMEEAFMASYLPDEEERKSPISNNNLEMDTQYGLDKETDEPIIMGLGAIVIKEGRSSTCELPKQTSSDNMYPLLVLNPLFRLLRVLKVRTGDENLEGIDALLGCAVTMPSHKTIIEFESYGPSDQGDILDCLFYCINWFRELINAYARSKNSSYVEKILIRLRNIVALQNLLAKLLGSTLEYSPPQCMFYSKPKKLTLKPTFEKTSKKKRNKKKKVTKKGTESQLSTGNLSLGRGSQNKEEEEEEDECEEDVDNDDSKKDDQFKPVVIALYKDYFRELDLDVFLVVGNELTISPRPERGADTYPELGPAELKYLLEDYVSKLEHSFNSGLASRWAKFRSTSDTEGSSSFAIWDLIPLSEKGANAISFLPVLCEKLEVLSECCRSLLEANDGLYDGPGMFLESTIDIKVCFGLILKAMSATFSWNGFQSVHHADLLQDGLKVLATRTDDNKSRRLPLPVLIKGAACYLHRFHKWILHLEAGVHLVKLLQALGVLWDLNAARSSTTSARKPTQKVLEEVCKEFLSRVWCTLDGTPEKGLSYTTRIKFMLKTYFDAVENELNLLSELIPKICTEAKTLPSKDSNFESFNAVSKYNFYVLYQVLYEALIKGTIKELEKENESEHKIKVWKAVFKCTESFVDVTQAYPGRAYLLALLKHTQELLKHFLSKGMPVLEYTLRSEPDDVMSILRSSQTTTRFINKVCLSCKTSQDSVLMREVPKIRGTMETLVYRVKGMMALNNIECAWNMGNLRNRDIFNVELFTQESADDQSELPEAEQDDADVTALESDDSESGIEEEESRNGSKKKKASKRKSNESDSEGHDSDNDSDSTTVSVAY